MCRSIKTLRRAGERATAQEVQEAALQYVRKISGYHRPSRANTPAFEAAVAEVVRASQVLLDSLEDGRRRPLSRLPGPDATR